MANAERNFSLTDEPGWFADAQVKSGRHISDSEVVREAPRRYQDDISREQGHLDYLRKPHSRPYPELRRPPFSRRRVIVLRVLFTDSATRQADDIGAWGEERFREAVRGHYDLLLAQAVINLAEAPGRRDVEV